MTGSGVPVELDVLVDQQELGLHLDELVVGDQRIDIGEVAHHRGFESMKSMFWAP